MVYVCINSSVELNSRYLKSKKLLSVAYVINVIFVNLRERSAVISDYTVLTAVVDSIIAYNMRTYLFLAPACLYSSKHSFKLILIARFPAEVDGRIMSR